MGNSNMELDIRLNKVERMLEQYRSTIEPKSGEFVGQNWYDTSTEVLNVWNGREFTPAYGSVIIQDIEGFRTSIEQNTTDIALRVEKDSILAEINLSSEGVRIQGNRIRLDGNVEVDGSFTVGSLGGDLDDIDDGSTYKKTTQNEKTGADRAYGALNASDRYKNWLVNTELSSGSNPTNGVVMDSGGIRGYDGGTKTFEIDTGGNAYFKGEIAATAGVISGDLTVTSGGSLFVGGTGTGLFIQNGVGGPGIDFYDGNQGVGFIEGTYQKPITIGGTTYYLDCINVSKDFYVGRDLIINDDLIVGDDLYVDGTVLSNLTLAGSADIELSDTGNRIKSGTDGEIYYNGTVWRKRDSTGWSDL